MKPEYIPVVLHPDDVTVLRDTRTGAVIGYEVPREVVEGGRGRLENDQDFPTPCQSFARAER